MTTTILPTRNEAWGFFGTMQPLENDPTPMQQGLGDRRERDDRRRRPTPRPRGCATSSTAATAATSPTTSRANSGRARRSKDAIEAAIARWKGWRIGRRTSRDEGIPRGLPYLTGLVTHFGILAELPTDRPPFRLPPRARGMRGSGS